ncbi:hypothetical protein bcere0019_24890 [Bacillus cereus Rock3-28]|nr:hypothetical protein bcere0019_24890 [Bacillus cereus Rock3-28]
MDSNLKKIKKEKNSPMFFSFLCVIRVSIIVDMDGVNEWMNNLLLKL